MSCSWKADTSNSGSAWKLGSCNLGGSGSVSTAEIGDFASLIKLRRRRRGLPDIVIRFNADFMAATVALVGVLDPSETGVWGCTGSFGIINCDGGMIWRGFGGSGGASSVSRSAMGESERNGSDGNKSKREPSEWSPSSSVRLGVSVLLLPLGVFGREKEPDRASVCSEWAARVRCEPDTGGDEAREVVVISLWCRSKCVPCV